jgi:carbonic anhydrase
MDARIDALEVLGLDLGDAHVLRNAGGRVTEDVLHGLRISSERFATSTVVLVEHTDCAAGIDDHAAALQADIDLVVAAGLDTVTEVAGCVYDVTDGTVREVHHWETSTKHGFVTLQG